MANLQEIFRGRKKQEVLFWNLSFPDTLKTQKNAIRNQFEQQWFNVISYQKSPRVYRAIW